MSARPGEHLNDGFDMVVLMHRGVVRHLVIQAGQIRDALKQVIVAMKINRRRHSQLLDEEYELIRSPH